jgi:hypothetical protein
MSVIKPGNSWNGRVPTDFSWEISVVYIALEKWPFSVIKGGKALHHLAHNMFDTANRKIGEMTSGIIIYAKLNQELWCLFP